ncbi:hypothetical protein PIB30_108649, partial [Stylosanthes scabra]|nr:hypothetical protein [Stylosanthes scabra]
TEMATRGRGRNTASTRTGSRSNTTEILAAINPGQGLRLYSNFELFDGIGPAS